MNNSKIIEEFNMLLKFVQRQICLHEDTYRGGTNWEICDSCGKKWADDEGGRPKNDYPKEVKRAEDFLDSLSKNT